jgi:HJR/Mrr/RecB family endonuclease
MAKKKSSKDNMPFWLYLMALPFIVMYYFLKIIGLSLYTLFSALLGEKRRQANQKQMREAFYKIMNSEGNLETIDAMSTHGQDFELFTVQLLLHNGYDEAFATPASGDYGIDVIAKKGGESYAIQCKCYSKPVGNKAVQEAYSGKSVYKCDHAVVFTNNYYTKAAKITAKENNVMLWDRSTLIDMMCNVDTKDKPEMKPQRSKSEPPLMSILLVILWIALVFFGLLAFSLVIAVEKSQERLHYGLIYGIPCAISLVLIIAISTKRKNDTKK